MNQQEIESRLDRKSIADEDAMDKRMRQVQRTILSQLVAMYQKYEREGDLTYQEMQKYNRLEKELQRIGETLTAEYRQTVLAVQSMQENHYLVKFLLTAYLFDRFVTLPSLPTREVIAAAVIFIIGSLKLPRLSGSRETNVINAIEKALRKSTENRDDIDMLSKRIQDVLPKDWAESKELSGELAKALLERLEPAFDKAGITIPTAVEVKREVKFDGLTLSHYLTVRRNRVVQHIKREIETALRKNETVSQMSKRINVIFDKEINSLRLFMRNVSDRVRAIALGNVENQIASISKVQGMWLSKRDAIVRKAHRKLDGERTDRKGYFHYAGLKAKAPRMWGVPSMDNYCRCKKLTMLDFKVPIVAEGVEYNNEEYSRQLNALAEKKVKEQAITFEKAFAEAIDEIPEPQGNMPFVAYEEWLRVMGVKGDLSEFN